MCSYLDWWKFRLSASRFFRNNRMLLCKIHSFNFFSNFDRVFIHSASNCMLRWFCSSGGHNAALMVRCGAILLITVSSMNSNSVSIHSASCAIFCFINELKWNDFKAVLIWGGGALFMPLLPSEKSLAVIARKRVDLFFWTTFFPCEGLVFFFHCCWAAGHPLVGKT